MPKIFFSNEIGNRLFGYIQMQVCLISTAPMGIKNQKCEDIFVLRFFISFFFFVVCMNYCNPETDSKIKTNISRGLTTHYFLNIFLQGCF